MTQGPVFVDECASGDLCGMGRENQINVKFLKTRSIGEQCKKMHLSENVTISKNREKDMWIEGSKSFSVKPYS